MIKLGQRNLYLSVTNIEGLIQVHLRFHFNPATRTDPRKRHMATVRGISLSFDEWKELHAHIDRVDHDLYYNYENCWLFTTRPDSTKIALAIRNIFAEPRVDLRLFTTSQHDEFILDPTTSGVLLHLTEWRTLVEAALNIDLHIDEIQKQHQGAPLGLSTAIHAASAPPVEQLNH